MARISIGFSAAVFRGVTTRHFLYATCHALPHSCYLRHWYLAPQELGDVDFVGRPVLIGFLSAL